jgi:hypothetical protein
MILPRLRHYSRCGVFTIQKADARNRFSKTIGADFDLLHANRHCFVPLLVKDNTQKNRLKKLTCFIHTSSSVFNLAHLSVKNSEITTLQCQYYGIFMIGEEYHTLRWCESIKKLTKS